MASDFLRRIKEFDTVTPLPLETRGPGTYEVKFLVEGNSILSTIFVSGMDPGTTVSASYWDSTTGSDVGEEFPLVDHRPLTAPGHDRLTVTRIHNKPNLRVTVTGGNARFGVYVTVVASFASDLDSALQFEGELVNILRDKGMPITAYEETTDTWSFLRTKDGRLQIDVPGVLQTTQQLINFRRYNATLTADPGTEYQHVNFVVPPGKRFFFLAGHGSADGTVQWIVEIDGFRWNGKRSTYDNRDVNLFLGSPVALDEGQSIVVVAKNLSPYSRPCEIETWIFGALEDV